MLVMMLLAGLLGGCVILPIPIAPSGERAEAVTRLEIGESTRAEVHKLLGRPNLLTTPRHELWEIERQPFHLAVLLAIAGPGGGGGGGILPLYPGGESPARHRITIDYDDRGRVSGWRSESVQLDQDQEIRPWSLTTYAASAPRVEPVSPGRWRLWSVQGYALSPHGERAALLYPAEEGRAQLELLDLARARSLALSREWPAACEGDAIMLGFDADAILTLPAQRGLLCRWRAVGDALVAEVTSSPSLRVALQGRATARLLGRVIVIRQGATYISIWEAAGGHIATLPIEERLSSSNLGLDADASSLAAAFFSRPQALPRVLLVQVAGGVHQVLSLGALAEIMALALAPDGDLLAVRDNRHVEIWRLPRALSAAPALEAALPLPFDLPAGSELAFSPDGRRLVLASTGALVWDVEGWRQVGRVPFLTFPNAVRYSRRLELTPDGSHLATPSGLWRIAPKRTGSEGHEQ
jgi:hypothetical protein